MKTERGVDVPFDDHGSNVAFACPCCGFPVLATLPPTPANMRKGRGGSQDDPVGCRKCMRKYWVDQVGGTYTLHAS